MKHIASLAFLSLLGCESDAINPAATYRCNWPQALVCEEYFPYDAGGGRQTVNHTEAERACTNPADAPNDYGQGSFAEAECPHADALGRCVMVPGYLARRYYYVGFQGVTGPDDPLNDAIDSACDVLGPGGTYQRPPFPD